MVAKRGEKPNSTKKQYFFKKKVRKKYQKNILYQKNATTFTKTSFLMLFGMTGCYRHTSLRR